MVEKNITLYVQPNGQNWKKVLLQYNITEYNILGENMVIPDDWDHFNSITGHDVFGAGQ